MYRKTILLLFLLLAVAMLGSCAFHSTATHWHGRVGQDGQPVFLKVTTNVGFNLLILIPLLGGVTIDSMIDEAAQEIAEEGGDYVRVFQTTSENYWYGLPPITWILTPVITNVSMEYRPSEKVLAEELARQRKKPQLPPPGERDNIIPEPRRR